MLGDRVDHGGAFENRYFENRYFERVFVVPQVRRRTNSSSEMLSMTAPTSTSVHHAVGRGTILLADCPENFVPGFLLLLQSVF